MPFPIGDPLLPSLSVLNGFRDIQWCDDAWLTWP